MQPKLHIRFEQSFGGLVCGVDEAGRGPLAGPVVAAAVILHSECLPDGIGDSKKLSARRREQLYEQLLAQAEVATGLATVEEIDTLNILRASLLAMQRAVEALPSYGMLHAALIDGNQRAPLSCTQHTFVQGDARCLSIAAASIVAKVTRDRIMADYARQYPEYGFDGHAGYGTAAHLAALERHGITPIHRRSFAPISRLLERAA
jgi:ribonuclease HII